MSENREQSRRDQILDAAFESVGRYGYKRTSMDDIAAVVGISRPALYQIFKNKADIYRAGLQRYCDESLEAVSTALAEDLPMEDRLRKAFDEAIVTPHRVIESMPHGAEILSQKQDIGQDLMDAWTESFGELLRAAFKREMEMSDEAAYQLAATVMNVVTGVKARGLSSDEAEQELENLLGVMRLVG